MSLPIVVTHSCTLFHNGIRQLLTKSQFRPVRIATSLTQDLEEYVVSQASCVWLTGVESTTNELVRKVVQANGNVKVVILAPTQRPDEIVAALRAGACGFLLHDIPAEQLLRSLELIAFGKMMVHPGVAWKDASKQAYPEDQATDGRNNGSLLATSGGACASTQNGDADGQNARDVMPTLSRRETLILRKLVQGESNKTIARSLVITESTVKVHMKAILRKLRLQNRTQAAIWARNHIADSDRILQMSSACN